MKIVSYNLNGIRSATSKGLVEWINSSNVDIFCFQETRANGEQIADAIRGLDKSYLTFWSESERKGYSGTGIVTRIEPLNAYTYLPSFKTDTEGRFTVLEYDKFILINCYVPNGGTRLEFKLNFMDTLVNDLHKLIKQKKEVIFCTDINIAHNEIDVSFPKQATLRTGFLTVEREKFEDVLKTGLTDSFRYLHPDKQVFSWSSYRAKIIGGNFGWKYRFDYVFLTKNLLTKLQSCEILTNVMYSDHFPVVCEVEI